ncbi:phospholipase C/P1 nuclease [Lindgomyces ingoldianus]|uniref:Phospholipase C/P1 nuclease n=1 Tax=Lindgomyces ingoldianus TaxID=673940 RepID=A0ACB6R0S6_9PLEO|nr:phospholipase C/P1 nuclease [Lindgomyces ingoldianus]KAF2472859.1 phospholipase C/P1 nuclease [Lindgomyces ingoldianus]
MRSLSPLLILLSTPTVHSWGELGHRTVGYLAEKYLTTDATAMVTELLVNDKGYDISDAALWADSVKRRTGYTHTRVWHYIDAEDDPPTQCGIKYNRDCKPKKGCIVSAIVNMTSRISSPKLDSTQHKEALMFLIHFLGDIHQPLHTEALDRGGNDIHACFDSHCSKKENLHSIWDTQILHKSRGLPASESDDKVLKDAAQTWATELFEASSLRVWNWDTVAECKDLKKAEDCALKWAGESNKLVCGYVLERGVEWIEQNDLGGEYFEGAVPVVDEMVSKAGLRLGTWLNEIAGARRRVGLLREQERMEM